MLTGYCANNIHLNFYRYDGPRIVALFIPNIYIYIHIVYYIWFPPILNNLLLDFVLKVNTNNADRVDIIYIVKNTYVMCVLRTYTRKTPLRCFLWAREMCVKPIYFKLIDLIQDVWSVARKPTTASATKTYYTIYTPIYWEENWSEYIAPFAWAVREYRTRPQWW